MAPRIPPPLRARRRRQRQVYAAVLTVVVAAAAVTAGVVIATGEAAHATLSTSPAADPLPKGQPATAPVAVWSTDDHPATGDPLWVGTVITWSAHELDGRDALTGDIRWSYRRTDVTVCGAGQRDGRAFALFRRAGNCDELSSFDASTGQRGWFRTLPDDGTGRILFGGAGMVVVYPRSFHAIDTGSGLERYPSVSAPAGCTLSSAAAGSTGILLTERCSNGSHLALYDNFSDKKQPLWRVPVDAAAHALAVESDAVVDDPSAAASGAGGPVSLYAVSDGAFEGSVGFDPPPSGAAGGATTAGQTAVLQVGDGLYALRSASPAWTFAGARGPAEAVDTAGSAVLVATASGAARIDTATGSVGTEYTFAAPAAGSRVYPAGTGLLVAGNGLQYLR